MLCYLLHYTKLEVLLVIINSWIAVLVLIAEVQDRLAGHTLLSPGDGGHFPHSSGRSVTNVASLHTLTISLPSRGSLHLCGAVGVDGPNVLVVLHLTTEGVRHVIVVILLPLALHEQAGALHKLVHGHGVVLGVDGEQTGDARCGQSMVWVDEVCVCFTTV